jgi:hypothetical protein
MLDLFYLVAKLALFEAAVANTIMWVFFTLTESTAIYGLWFNIHPEDMGKPKGRNVRRAPGTQMGLEWLNSYLWFASVPTAMLWSLLLYFPFERFFTVMAVALWLSWWICWFRGLFTHRIWKTWVVIIFVPFRGFELFASVYCMLVAYGYM